MGATTFTGPVVSGDLLAGQTNGPNQGFCALGQQTLLLESTTAGAVTSNIYVPAGSVISAFDIDVLTAFAASGTISFGITGTATKYTPAVALTSTGRISITYTAAQLAAMNGLTTAGAAAVLPPAILVTLTNGGGATAGVVNVTVKYYQLTSSN